MADYPLPEPNKRKWMSHYWDREHCFTADFTPKQPTVRELQERIAELEAHEIELGKPGFHADEIAWRKKQITRQGGR